MDSTTETRLYHLLYALKGVHHMYEAKFFNDCLLDAKLLADVNHSIYDGWISSYIECKQRDLRPFFRKAKFSVPDVETLTSEQILTYMDEVEEKLAQCAKNRSARKRRL